jgi:hypothetical protein
LPVARVRIKCLLFHVRSDKWGNPPDSSTALPAYPESMSRRGRRLAVARDLRGRKVSEQMRGSDAWLFNADGSRSTSSNHASPAVRGRRHHRCSPWLTPRLLTPRSRLPAIIRFFVIAIVSGVALNGGSALAQGDDEQIVRYDVRIVIGSDGGIGVTEKIEYDFGRQQHHGIFRDIRVRFRHTDVYDRLYQVTGISVRGSPGTPVTFTLENLDGYQRIRIGDPDRTISGRHTYAISYRVAGALNGFADHDELYWNLIDSGWSVPIEQATGEISAPELTGRVRCFSGPRGAAAPCSTATVEDNVARFSQHGLDPNEAFTFVVDLPKGTVPEPTPKLAERATEEANPLLDAFSVTPVTLTLVGALLAVMLGWFGVIAWRNGRDRSAVETGRTAFGKPHALEERGLALLRRGSGPTEYAPPKGLRPGEMAILLYERVDDRVVGATILDLAVRGYLRIEEMAKKRLFGKRDWTLYRLRGTEGLLPYEGIFMDGLFAEGSTVKLSSLKGQFAETWLSVKEAMNEDAVTRGWFDLRPDIVRQKWARRGLRLAYIGFLVTIVLAWKTHFALVSLPTMPAGLLLVLGARLMPRQTETGAGLSRRIGGFRRYIKTSEVDESPFAYPPNTFPQYLPYAVVFGEARRWIRAFDGLADTVLPTWYLSPVPFHPSSFSHSVQQFASTSSQTLSFTSFGSGGSGFSGGGFSGGGGGGGGGGSW